VAGWLITSDDIGCDQRRQSTDGHSGLRQNGLMQSGVFPEGHSMISANPHRPTDTLRCCLG